MGIEGGGADLNDRLASADCWAVDCGGVQGGGGGGGAGLVTCRILLSFITL